MSNTSTSRSKGSIRVARSLWYTAAGSAEIRAERLTPAAPGWLTIETHYTGLSRGTERLVWSGGVPESEWQRMRAPFQAGDFPFPVKYGYSAAGVVVDGPSAWIGKHTFALHPHQDVFALPPERVTEIPEGVPLKRATLAANMETALNAVWDSGTGPGDTVVVVGAGIVGLLVAFLTAGMPGTRVYVVDIAAERKSIAAAMGATFVVGGDDVASAVGGGADVVFHTSASGAGLETAIGACGFEGVLVEMSWYGDRDITVNLGGAFHAKRLQLISSQVGHVAATRRARWSYARRLETAAQLLNDERLDLLVGDSVAFDDLPQRLAGLFADGDGLSPVIAYPAAT